MYTRGEYTADNVTYGAIVNHTKARTEAILVVSGAVVSAYKTDESGSYSYNTVKAKQMVQALQTGIRGCTSKNGTPMPFELGALTQHEFTKSKVEYSVQLHKGELVGAFIQSDSFRINIEYDKQSVIPDNIPYIKLTETKKDIEVSEDDLDAVPVRSVQEIALEKDDITWLKNKKYYIVNDDATAEKLFTFFDNYNGVIAYDTETTGLKINCFGKINSHYQKELIKYNNENPENKIRADKLVGIIFCVENDTSYYFPCFNRKFKNLYQDKESPVRKSVISRIKARYTVGDLRNTQSDMADYVRNTNADDFDCDVILMERVRDILQTKHLVAHNGSFEWKVGWQYEIDTNLKDDTMIMHQLMYKFRSTTSNRGEPSNLKYLAKRELGVDQWELSDFFPDWKADNTGTVRDKTNKKGKKSGSRIDFSYMDYEGTRVYAPTDGDVTFQLYNLYKKDMKQNHMDMEYIYNVEIIVSCAIGYMEFYGHKLDEDKILGARRSTQANIALIESEIRQMINYSSEKEVSLYNQLKSAKSDLETLEKNGEAKDKDNIKLLGNKMSELTDSLNKAIEENTEYTLNLASPAQVADLFYNKLGIPVPGEKQSVAKKELKALLKEKNEDGTAKYPVVKKYSDYKNEDTLLTKFFDNLPYFMYPGGFIFSSYGQISTATGRMSCSKPNAQQYPKVITKIVSPRDGYVMMDADYSQIEYRVLTALAGNTELARLFSSPDSDYHTLMASLMYGVDYSAVTSQMRSAAKSFNFGIPYGMGLGSLAILLTGKNTPQTRDEAAEKMEDYFKNQPRTREFFNNVKEMAQVNGYTKTLFDRYRYYTFTDKDGNINNGKKAAALRQAGNAVIQGCIDGETRIQTKKYGIIKIKEVVGQRLTVWDGENWVLGDIAYSGKKQKCIVTLGNNQKFVCSPIHKFLTRSSKGNENFVECKNLRSSDECTNPHRIVINKQYTPSDYKYTSEYAIADMGTSHNANNSTLEDVGDSFKIGVILGRLASDGSIFNREVGGSSIRQIIAEHEEDVAGILMDYMKPLGAKMHNMDVRDDRNERMIYLDTYSKSIVNEISRLDVKHKIHDKLFSDTEMLRGFIRGMFDGDGGISGKTITLVFGTQYDFEDMCRDLQKALTMLGIRSRYSKYDYRHKITISTYDNKKFMDLIGFVGKDKNNQGRALKTVRENKMFDGCLTVKSVEITDEYIDMYDVCNTDNGYYVADGIITHNTAADIFKIGVARNFTFIRRNHLFGDVLIINMIHDEQLIEVNVQKLNMQRVLAEVGENMQFKLPDFPPLYIGAGVGKAWGYAKGKMAEIHPLLLEEFTKEAKEIPLRRTAEEIEKEPVVDVHKVLNYFDNRVYEFRRKKVADYLSNPENWHKALHPAIAGLINLQFNFGRGDDAKAYIGPNGETYSDKEFLSLNVADFLKENNIPAEASWFEDSGNKAVDEEEDAEYSDDDTESGEPDFEVVEGDDSRSFTLITEDDTTYGCTLHDIINEFGACVLQKQKICGINTKNMYFKKKDAIIDYLMHFICDSDEDGACQIVFLTDANVLNYTNIYVKGVDPMKLDRVFSGKALSHVDYSDADVNNRSQAK